MAAKSGRQALDTLGQPSACGDEPANLDAFCHGLIKMLQQVANEIRQILDTPCQPSACGDKYSRLEAICRGLIQWLEQVKNEIRQILDTPCQPSACGDKYSRLEAICRDLIQWLEQVENEIRQEFDKLRQPSACGDEPSRLEAICRHLIQWLEQVENKIRQILDTPCQPSACGDKYSRLEAICHGLIQWLEQVKNEIRNTTARFESVETRLQFLESCHRQQAASDHYKMQETNSPDPLYQEGHRSYQEVLPGEVTQKELDKTEECKKLKEINKELEAKNSKLLSKVMSIHKNSENMNDPFRLSAVLDTYEMLRLREWEKFRRVSSLTYKSGSKIIKKLFDACEKDIQQRTTNIFEVLDISTSNDAMTTSKQEVMQEIRNLFRYSYSQNDSKIYHNIISKAGIDTKLGTQRQFAVQCCKVYCFLLLQDPPVKAAWNLHEMQCLEHVDKKDSDHWEKPAFLWPIMKCREQAIVKGVVWDEK